MSHMNFSDFSYKGRLRNGTVEDVDHYLDSLINESSNTDKYHQQTPERFTSQAYGNRNMDLYNRMDNPNNSVIKKSRNITLLASFQYQSEEDDDEHSNYHNNYNDDLDNDSSYPKPQHEVDVFIDDDIRYLDNIDVHADGTWAFINGAYCKVHVNDSKELRLPPLVPTSQFIMSKNKPPSMLRPRIDSHDDVRNVEKRLQGLSTDNCRILVSTGRNESDSELDLDLEEERLRNNIIAERERLVREREKQSQARRQERKKMREREQTRDRMRERERNGERDSQSQRENRYTEEKKSISNMSSNNRNNNSSNTGNTKKYVDSDSDSDIDISFGRTAKRAVLNTENKPGKQYIKNNNNDSDTESESEDAFASFGRASKAKKATSHSSHYSESNSSGFDKTITGTSKTDGFEQKSNSLRRSSLKCDLSAAKTTKRVKFDEGKSEYAEY